MCYRTPEGVTGQAKSGIWASGQAGLLWFFDRGNAEVLVKVLDGRSHNGYRWVFVAPVTTLEFNLSVTAPNGRRWTHSNRQRATASTKADVRAFSCSDEIDGGTAGAPDRVVQSPAVSDTNLSPGESFVIHVTVRNQGDGRSGSTTLGYYRSSDATVGTADVRVGTVSVGAPSASSSSRESISLTAQSIAGTYYYGACVEAVSGESNSANNCSSGVVVTVGGGPDEVIGTGFDLDRDNGESTGIVFGQGGFFVPDLSDDKVYAYRGADGLRSSFAEFDLPISSWSRGITYGEGRFYVLDTWNSKVHAYRGSDGRRDAAADFDLDSDIEGPHGIAYAAGRLYIVGTQWKAYSFRSSDGRRDGAADFDLDSDNAYPRGITYAEGRFYVVDGSRLRVYAYRGSDGRRDAAADLYLSSSNRNPEGITYAGGKLFVVDDVGEDRVGDKVYAYSLDR